MPAIVGCMFISSSSSSFPTISSSANLARSISSVTVSSSSGHGQSFSPSVAARGTSFAAPATKLLSLGSSGAPPKSTGAVKAPICDGSSAGFSCSNNFSTASFICGANFSTRDACALLYAESRNACASTIACSNSFELLIKNTPENTLLLN